MAAPARSLGARRGLLLPAALCALTLLAACRSGHKNFANDNDALRAQVLELQKQVDDLTRRNTELQAELRDSSTVSDSLPEEVRAATPHPVELDIDRLSHAIDGDHDGLPDALVVYVHAVDGLGRFTQLVGHLAVTAAVVPAKADAITVGRATLDPLELRNAYRSGLTGTHYTVQVPITLPQGFDAAAASAEATVWVTFTDGLTGQTRKTQRAIPLSR